MSDLNQLFKRKNQPSLHTNSHPSSSFSSSSSFSRPTLESENSGLTGLTGSTGLTSRNNDATTKRIFSKLDNLQKMLEKIMKNQEKMQEVTILSYDQDCVYSVILESAQDLLEKIIYSTLDQFKETAKSFMEKSDINFFSSLGHRWEPFYHKKIRVDGLPISIIAEASKISAWKKNPAISNSFRKLFDKVEEDEKDTYMTRIIKNVWPKKKNISNLQIAWVIFIAEIILNPNNKNIKISEEIIKPFLLKNLNKIENNESFEYESDSPERLEVTPKRLVAPKKSAVPEKPTAPRSNKRITEIETSQKEKKKIRSIRKDEENNNNDDEADEGDKAYKANEAYETDEGDEYYNEIINIDEKIFMNIAKILRNIAKYCEIFLRKPSKNKIENNESFEYESDSPERLEVTPKRLVAPKKSAVPEKPTAPRSNKRITEIETSQKEKKKIRSIRKDEENNNNDDEADEGDKAYKANEAYETDEGDEYYNEIINIDESEEK
ncbi:hypothetical protein Glove_393g51 [Diversispora epigaea]|uniref:Uncharacterized protein n=1 Tax=Diversispora epigaea TaxID=1348612 RepID=A0A397H332_9GLOM|nr:hypothetical protein Glove_393g51 [Diversispora epigaea]